MSDISKCGAIREVFQEYMDAIAAGDAERAMAVWAKDAIYYPPNNSSAIYGWDAIAARARSYLARFDTRHEISSDGTEVRDDLAVDRGTWVQTATPKSGGEPTVIRAKYVRVLRKQADGTWKIWLDIWNRITPEGQ
jgi:uncharacterized protein (TIGR02246 family)